jgi:Alkylmercury lyase
MANPLSAAPTTFRVATPRGEYWGTCAWDALGVVAMLGREGSVRAQCADCNQPLELRVEAGELLTTQGVAHFAVPARRWWENIAFT